MISLRNEDNKIIRGLNVTTLIKKFNRDEEKLLMTYLNGDVVREDLYTHQYSYKPIIEKKKLYCKMGVFYDYFIRVYLAMFNKLEFEDRRSIHVSSKFESGYYEKYYEEQQPIKRFIECYNVVSSEVITDRNFFLSERGVSLIWNVAQLHLVFFHDGIFELQEQDAFNFVEKDNLEELISVLDKIFQHKDTIILNPEVGGFYFRGDGDLIVDDQLIDFKCAKYPFVPKKYFFQHLLYAFGYYLNDNKTVNQLVIFNPLLGTKHSLNISISFEELENSFFKKCFDMEKYLDI